MTAAADELAAWARKSIAVAAASAAAKVRAAAGKARGKKSLKTTTAKPRRVR